MQVNVNNDVTRLDTGHGARVVWLEGEGGVGAVVAGHRVPSQRLRISIANRQMAAGPKPAICPSWITGLIEWT